MLYARHWLQRYYTRAASQQRRQPSTVDACQEVCAVALPPKRWHVGEERISIGGVFRPFVEVAYVHHHAATVLLLQQAIQLSSLFAGGGVCVAVSKQHSSLSDLPGEALYAVVRVRRFGPQGRYVQAVAHDRD